MQHVVYMCKCCIATVACRSFSSDVIAAMLEDDNKRFLVSFYC